MRIIGRHITLLYSITIIRYIMTCVCVCECDVMRLCVCFVLCCFVFEVIRCWMVGRFFWKLELDKGVSNCWLSEYFQSFQCCYKRHSIVVRVSDSEGNNGQGTGVLGGTQYMFIGYE
eukprot:c8580_g1_i7.p1 GENE.c8580_g1_i7~~c8580_g1_i7.p1  ORF type:complete len:117 (-),score=11.29 c8580_g1_i7:316-666(-)